MSEFMPKVDFLMFAGTSKHKAVPLQLRKHIKSNREIPSSMTDE